MQEIIDQVYQGQPPPTFWSQQQKLVSRATHYILRSLHSTLFKVQSAQDEALTAKVEQLQWVTAEQFGVKDCARVRHPKLWEAATKHLT